MAAIPPVNPVLGGAGAAPPIPPLPAAEKMGSKDLNPGNMRSQLLMPLCFEHSVFSAGSRIHPERLLQSSEGFIASLDLATSDRLTHSDFILIPLYAEIVSRTLPLAISHFHTRPGITMSPVVGEVGDWIDTEHLSKLNWLVAHVLSHGGTPEPGDPWEIKVLITQKYRAEHPVEGTTIAYWNDTVCPCDVKVGATVTFNYRGARIFVPADSNHDGLTAVPLKAELETRTFAETRNSIMSSDGTHIIVKPANISLSDLLDSLGLMRALGNSPRYEAFMGKHGCVIDNLRIKGILEKSGLDFEHPPAWLAGSRNIVAHVTPLPVFKDPNLYALFLRFKYAAGPGCLLWASFLDPSHGPWNPEVSTAPLVSAMKGLSLMAELHFGPTFRDWLRDIYSRLEDRDLSLKFGPAVLYLQTVRALLRFSSIMRLEGSGVNGDEAASAFGAQLEDPVHSVGVTLELLPRLLQELFTDSSILQAKLNYDLLMVRVGLTSTSRNAASAAAPAKSSLKRTSSVVFDEAEYSPGHSGSSSPEPRGSPSSPKAQKPLGKKDGRSKVPPICFRHLRAELGDKNRGGKLCPPCQPRGDSPCPSTHFMLRSWTRGDLLQRVSNAPADPNGEKDRVLTLLKDASPSKFKQG